LSVTVIIIIGSHPYKILKVFYHFQKSFSIAGKSLSKPILRIVFPSRANTTKSLRRKFCSGGRLKLSGKEPCNMLKNKMIAFALCASLGILLAGCGDEVKNDVSSTVSRIESGMEEAGSKVGSAMESMMEPDSSRDMEESSREESIRDEEASPNPSPEAR
jgi:outer membrane murein-binding lipoprotein Lpp